MKFILPRSSFLNFIILNITAPNAADKIEAIIILILAIDKALSSVNDKDETKSDIVNPIPPSTLAPYKCLLVTLDGNFASFNFTKIYEAPKMPICFPINNPKIMPRLTGFIIAVDKLLKSIVMPEFANANIGIIINEDNGVRTCSNLYKIDVLNSSIFFSDR